MTRMIAIMVTLTGCGLVSLRAMADLPRATEWNAGRAAHLLRRAAFGGTPAEVAQMVDLGLDGAVSSLVDFETIPQTDPDFAPIRAADRAAMRQYLRDLSEERRREVRDRLQQASRRQIEEMRAWWIRRMIVTPRPFEEKMTLFWHGHFTSGFREVRSANLMLDQNVLFREHGLGSYRELLVKVSQDPAMLRYLDNASNRKGAPNENFARELLELFTLGEGHYTERDIKEAARALTGWSVDEDGFRNRPGQHDGQEKTFLGRTGRWDGYDIIDIILDEPQSARYLAYYILAYFVTPTPDAQLVDALAGVVREEGFDLRAIMRTLFLSEAFYADAYRQQMVKSPVYLVVGTMRLLEAEPRDAFALQRAAAAMGQELFQPPSVKGWDGGRRWINTATLFTRYNFATGVLTGTQEPDTARLMRAMPRGRAMRRQDHRAWLREHAADLPALVIPDAVVTLEPQPMYDPMRIVERDGLFTADRVVNHYTDRLLQTRIDLRQRRALRELLTGESGKFDHRAPIARQRLVSLLNALLTMPEYQLN